MNTNGHESGWRGWLVSRGCLIVYLIGFLLLAGLGQVAIYRAQARAQTVGPPEIPRYTMHVAKVSPDEFGVARLNPNGDLCHFSDVQAYVDASVAEALANVPAASGAAGPWVVVRAGDASTLPTADVRGLLCETKAAAGDVPAQYAFRDYLGGTWQQNGKTGPAPVAWSKINGRVMP